MATHRRPRWRYRCHGNGTSWPIGAFSFGSAGQPTGLTGPTTFSSWVFPCLLGLWNTWHGRTVSTLSAGRVQLHRVRGREKVQGGDGARWSLTVISWWWG